MKFLDKLNKHNQRISFNIFALNGYVALLIYIYWTFFVKSSYVVLPFLIIFNALIISIFLIAFIVYCVEVVTQYKLSFGFLKNKRYSFILLFGTLVSMIYLLLLIMFFVASFIIMPLYS